MGYYYYQILVNVSHIHISFLEINHSFVADCKGDGGYIFFKDREEWKDVTPIPQNDGPVPVVMIAYSDEFKDVHDYFRAVLKSGEKSERVLDLTKEALEFNPANYTVWHYRREVLRATGADIREELQYSREMIEEHPKNYQVWQHRRVIVELLNDPSTELRSVKNKSLY